MKCSLGIIFLKRSLVFPILLFSSISFALITEEGFLISSCYSLELCIQMDISFLFFFAFHFSSFTAICKASSDNHFAFLYLFFLGMVLITASCSMSQTSISSSSGTLSDLIPWIYLSLPLYNHQGFDLGHTWMVLWFFPTFFNVSLNLAIRSSWSGPQSTPSLVFVDCGSDHELLIVKLRLKLKKVGKTTRPFRSRPKSNPLWLYSGSEK